MKIAHQPPPTPLRRSFDAIPTQASNTRARLLADNLEAWNARWELLESAQTSVRAQFYTWDRDIFGKAQLGHIFHKARQGVETTLMVDAVGDTFGTRGFKSHIGGKDYLQEVVALPNARARVYHPHWRKPLSALTSPTSFKGLAANHDKILEVDGRAASVGGRNTGHHYFLSPKDDPTTWRDGDVLLEGAQAASDLARAVDEEYSKKWVHDTVRPDRLGNWKKRDAELLGAYALMDLWLKGKPLDGPQKEMLRSDEEEQGRFAQQLARQAQAQLPDLGLQRGLSGRESKAILEMARELVAYPELRGSAQAAGRPKMETEVKIIDSHSAVGAGLNQMNDSLLGLIDGAQERIRIQTPYYVLTDPVIDALQAAGQRGVEIDIATNSPSNTDSFFTQVFFLNDWSKSLAVIPNLRLHAATGERKHHAKMAVFDEEVTFVGTYNLDLVSARVNGEVGAVLWSKEFVREVDQAIDADFADPSLGFVEYQIARDASGQALDAQGRPVLDARGELVGQPEVLFGPEDHVDPAILKDYDKRIRRWNWSRRNLPQFQSLRRFVTTPEGKEV